MKTLPIFSLQNKLILITGATSGIGRGAALACAASGARVIGIGRNPERIAEVQAELDAIGSGHRVAAFDVTDFDRIGELVAGLVAEHGKIDGFVHCAGIPLVMALKGMNARYYRRIFDVNVTAQFEFIRHVFADRRHSSDGGSVVLMSSIASATGATGFTAYAASKGALNSAMRPLALELAPRGIRVNALLPGLIADTQMGNVDVALPADTRSRLLERYYRLGFGKIEYVVGSIVFLLSPASCWMTGVELPVDGGSSL